MSSCVNVVFLGLLGLFAKGYQSGADVTESASFLVQTTTGGYAIRSCVYMSSLSEYDAAIAMLDDTGDLVWFKRIGWDADHEYFKTIEQVSDGLVAGGYSSSFNATDGFIVKTDFNGNLVWAYTYGGSSWDEILRIIATSDGGLLAVGATYSYGAGSMDAMILKLNADGSVAWSRTWGGSGSDKALDCVEVSDGYVITGYYNYTNADVFLLKLSTDGSLTWARTYDYGDELGLSLTAVSDGFVIGGQEDKYSGADALLLKTDLNGNFLWAHTYGGDDEDIFHSVALSPDGGIIGGGETSSFGAVWNMFLVKASSDGTMLWARQLDYSADNIFQVLPISNGFALGGRLSAAHSVITLNANGDYPDCFTDCSPNDASISMTTNSAGTLGSASIPGVSRTPNVFDHSPSAMEICNAASVDSGHEGSPGPAVRCVFASNGALFVANETTDLVIYSVAGTKVISTTLSKGENPVRLHPGIYMWQAGLQRGKLVVK